MGNIKNFNFNKLDLRLSNSDYWDFFINSDEYNDCAVSSDYSCEPVVNFTFSNINIFENFQLQPPEKIVSLAEWRGSKNKGVSLDTFGLTGIDNAAIVFDVFSGDTFNLGLLNALTGSTLILDEGDFKMRMTRVSGTTNEFIYPIELPLETPPFTFYNFDLIDFARYVKFCGGFFQGFYKLDGYDYQILPTRTNLGWSTEFLLRPTDCCICDPTIKPLNTFDSQEVILPTNISPGSCSATTNLILSARSQAIQAFINNGISAVTNNLNIEELKCTQVVKWRFNGEEVWLSRNITGQLDTFFISDYTDAQNTIIKLSAGTNCCNQGFIDTQRVWNEYLISVGLTGSTFLIDLPQVSATTCVLSKKPCPVTGKKLNDKFPNNKGFFFFTGTRAENKFWNVFSGASSGCTSGCTVSSGCTSALNKWCTIQKETSMSFVDNKNMLIPLSPVDYEYELVTNPFLIYGGSKCEVPDLKYTATTAGFLIDEFGNYVISEKSEKILIEDTTVFKLIDMTNSSLSGVTSGCSPCKSNCTGLGTQTACSYDGNGMMIKKKKLKKTNYQNPFLIYGRASKNSCNCCSCTGESDGFGTETVCSFSGFTSEVVELDNKADVIGNALGFRIKDDGSLGYRLLTYTGQCNSDNTYTTGATVEEGYSISGIVKSDVWSHIVIKFTTCSPLTGFNGDPLNDVDGGLLDDCYTQSAKSRKGRLSFYVNGKLVYWVDEFDEFIARRLNEHRDKQIGVPFNFSLGGGSQGLLESQTFDGLDLEDRGLLIEKNFAGTFIGDIAKFKYYLCPLSFTDIDNKFKNMWI